MSSTFFELSDGQVVCFNPNGRWHGWLFRKHPDGQFVSVSKLKEIDRPSTVFDKQDKGRADI